MTRPLLGLLFCALALLASLFDARAALSGWLAAVVLAGSLPLGALCLAMMLRIIPGPWRDALTGPCDEAMTLLPALVVLALPVVIGMPWLYPWFDGGLGGFKAVYLTPAFFGLRLLAILTGAAAFGFLLLASASQRLAIAGLIAFILLHGVLATDLVLSLTPDFHSSGFGLYMLGLHMLTALSLLVLRHLPETANPALLGKLLLTALLLWAYFAFMQYFISWSSNLPPGAKWFALRAHGVWAVAEYMMAALRLLPLLALLFPPVRSSPAWLAVLSVAILVGSVIEVAWLVLPSTGARPLIAIAGYLLALAGMTLVAPTARRLPRMWRQTA